MVLESSESWAEREGASESVEVAVVILEEDEQAVVGRGGGYSIAKVCAAWWYSLMD